MSHSNSAVASHFDTLAQQRSAASYGMWIFLASELMIFGALLAGYSAYRAEYPRDFALGSQRLNLMIGAVNTVVLLTSSLTMVFAVDAARVGKRRPLVTYLALTAALGVLFLALKAVEYYLDYREHLVPGLSFHSQDWLAEGADPAHVQLFLLFYYLMTGLHAIHLIVGIGLLAILTLLASVGRFSKSRHMPVELAGLYWHFVDIVWIFLLPLLYLVETRSRWS